MQKVHDLRRKDPGGEWRDRWRGSDEGSEPTRETGRCLNNQQVLKEEMMDIYMPERRGR